MAKKAAKKKAVKKPRKPTAAEKKLQAAKDAYYKKVADLSLEGEKLGLACIGIEREPIVGFLEGDPADELREEHELELDGDMIEDFINGDLACEVNDHIGDHLKSAAYNWLGNF